MFTGIVQGIARIASIADAGGFLRLNLAASWPDVKSGESVAINGCCLTVAEISDGILGFDVVRETLSKTNLGLLKAGDAVNVERSLQAGDRMDGHFVQGHVDGTARLIDQTADKSDVRLTLEPQMELMKFVVPKGSVCLDGVSLTVSAVEKHRFEVALIPTTMQLTTLGEMDIGWPFNFEADVLSKTIVSWLERRDGIGVAE